MGGEVVDRMTPNAFDVQAQPGGSYAPGSVGPAQASSRSGGGGAAPLGQLIAALAQRGQRFDPQ